MWVSMPLQEPMIRNVYDDYDNDDDDDDEDDDDDDDDQKWWWCER